MSVRPMLVVADDVAPTARVLFRFRGALREASLLARLVANVNWPNHTRLRLTLSQSEAVDLDVSGRHACHPPRNLSAFPAHPEGRGEVTVVHRHPADPTEIAKSLNECATALRQIGFDGVQVVGID